METPTGPGGASPEMVFDILMAYQRTAALRTAIELDLFRAIGAGPGSVAALSAQSGASERGVRILCDFLVVMDLIVKEGKLYRHTPTSKMFLDPESPTCLGATARFLSNPALTEPYSRLTEVVRHGRTVLEGDGTVEPENPVWVEFAHSMAPMMGPMAGPLGAILLAERNGPMRVLDIAAGHGLFGIEIAKQNPEAEIVAVDWAPVLKVAMENAAKAGVTDRYGTIPGSAFEVDYGGPYDVILLTNFLHHFDPPTCVGLLKKAGAALQPGGLVAALEFVPNEDRVSPPVAAAFSLTMLATTAAGDAYTFSELKQMYADAGFEKMRAHQVPTGPHKIVVGNKK